MLLAWKPLGVVYVAAVKSPGAADDEADPLGVLIDAAPLDASAGALAGALTGTELPTPFAGPGDDPELDEQAVQGAGRDEREH